MNRTRTSLSLATLLAVASLPSTPLRAQGTFGPRASCEAVFEALRSGDESAFEATLPSSKALAGFFRARGQGSRLQEPGAASEMRSRMLRAATDRFRKTRAAAGKQIDWTSARFLSEIPPETVEARHDLAPLAFLVHADGKVWQFGGNDVMRIGLTWSFVEGPFFHGPCDPEEAEKARLTLESVRDEEAKLREELHRAQMEIEQMRAQASSGDMSAAESRERSLREQEQRLREEFHAQIDRERKGFQDQMRSLEKALRKELELMHDAKVEAEAQCEKLEYERDEARMNVRRWKDESADRDAHIQALKVELQRLSARQNRPAPRSKELSVEERERLLDQSFTIDLDRIPADELLLAVGNGTGVPLVLGGQFILDAEEVVIGERKNRTAREWIDQLVDPENREWRHGVLFIEAPAPERTEEWLQQQPASLRKPVDVHFEFASMKDVFASFREQCDVQVWQTDEGRLALDAFDLELLGTVRLPVATIFDLVATKTETQWRCVDGVVLWTFSQPTTADALPEIVESRRSLELEEQTLPERLAAFSEAFGQKLEVESDLALRITNAETILPAVQLEDVRFSTVLKLFEMDIEEMTNSKLRWIREGNQLVLRWTAVRRSYGTVDPD